MKYLFIFIFLPFFFTACTKQTIVDAKNLSELQKIADPWIGSPAFRSIKYCGDKSGFSYVIIKQDYSSPLIVRVIESGWSPPRRFNYSDDESCWIDIWKIARSDVVED